MGHFEICPILNLQGCKVEHIPGEENIEADGFSRLVQPLQEEEESTL